MQSGSASAVASKLGNGLNARLALSACVHGHHRRWFLGRLHPGCVRSDRRDVHHDRWLTTTTLRRRGGHPVFNAGVTALNETLVFVDVDDGQHLVPRKAMSPE